MIMQTLTPFAFFKANAGFSYDPAKETKSAGRDRCARNLAQSEKRALAHGFSFQWEIDPNCDSSEFSNARPRWELWCCTMFDETGAPIGSIGGVDFGRDGSPWSDTYRRVVEAELAADHFRIIS